MNLFYRFLFFIFLFIYYFCFSGTFEYTQGLVEHVTVLLGIAIRERAIGGIIYQPFYKDAETGTLGRTVWGIDGVGVGGNFSVTPPPMGKRIITTTR